MRRLVISDLHFGDRNGCDLLQREWVQQRLWPLVDDADQLILLGDTFELVFQHAREAITAARPFFAELNRRYPRLDVVVVPGNHDHHLVAVASDEIRLREALGLPHTGAFRVKPAEKIIRTLAPNVNVSSAYPLYLADNVCFTHGHYLAAHLRNPGQRLYDHLSWRLWGQERRHELTAADYESLISPLYELTYQIAQLPDGVRTQREFERQAARLARVAQLPGQIGGQLSRFTQMVQMRSRHRTPIEALTEPVETLGETLGSPDEALEAIGHVTRNLGLADVASHVVFGHTHVAFANRALEATPKITYSNCGSFFFDWREMNEPDFRQRAWPGTAIVVDDGEVELHRLLEDISLEELSPVRVRRKRKYGG